MLAPSERRHTFRVLCLFPHPRFSGHAVLDDDGLVPSATFAMRTRRFRSLDARIASVEYRLRESLRLYRPDILAVVVGRRHGRTEAAGSRVVDVAATLPVKVVVVDASVLEELFRRPDGSLLDQLGQSLTGTFFAELVHRTGSWGLGADELRRPLRPVWRAAAGAVSVLAHHRPEAVRALARGPLPPALASLIERASRAPSP